MTEETIHITPHVVARTGGKSMELVKSTHEGVTALPVFRNELDAMRFMADSDHNPYDGFRPVPVDHEMLAGLLAIMGIDHVAASEAWTGTGSVDLFKGDVFVQMLEDSLRDD